MKTKQNGNWVIDLENLTCRNTENNLVIVFKESGPALLGKIKILPMRLAQEQIKNHDCENYIRKTVIEADEAFAREYFANKSNSGDQLIA